MSNLLPQSTQGHNRREYYLRFAAVSLYALAVLSLVATVLLVPSYILSSAKEEIAQKEQALFRERVELAAGESVAGQIEAINARAKILSSDIGPEVAPIIEKSVLGVRPRSVMLSDIRYERDSKGIRKVTIGGTAATRDALQQYVETLEKTGQFSSVELPLSNFVKRTNIEFVASMIIK